MATPGDQNEPRTGVRAPIVLVVLIGLLGVGGLIYVKKDDISAGSSRSGGSFSEVCQGMTPGTLAFDAKESLVAATARAPGETRPPDVQVRDREMVVRFTGPAGGASQVCTLQLDASGKSIATARFRAQPAP